jgi:hypothetical protein
MKFVVSARCDVRAGGAEISGTTRKGKARAVRLQYGALPYRFTPDAALEFLLVTTWQLRRWIIPKGLADKRLATGKIGGPRGLRGSWVRGQVGAKSVGLFIYEKIMDGTGGRFSCAVRIFPLLVKRQSETWPEIEQRTGSLGRSRQSPGADRGAGTQKPLSQLSPNA